MLSGHLLGNDPKWAVITLHTPYRGKNRRDIPMQFVLGNTRARRLDDCWGVATRAGDGAKAEWNSPKWFYATMRGAAHKMIEIELDGADPEHAAELRELEERIVSVYREIDRRLDEWSEKIDGKVK